jgi:hypothetical protein
MFASRPEILTVVQDCASPSALLSEEHVLNDLRRELEQVEADALDDANNYLRNKLDIKQLQQRLKQLRQQVAAMECKLQKSKARQRPQQDMSAEALLDARQAYTGDEEEGMFDLFAEQEPFDKPSTSVPIVTASEPIHWVEFPHDALKSWTGKTPRQLLQEHCTKHGLRRPRYTVNRRNCSVHVKLPSGDLEAELPRRYTFATNESVLAKEYVATRLLYLIHSDRPMYRLMPPFFAQLWKEWRAEEEAKSSNAKLSADSERREKIQRLIDLITTTVRPREALATPSDPNTGFAATTPPVDSSCVRRFYSKLSDERIREKFLNQTRSERYKKMLQERSALPIYPFRDRILDCIRSNAVTVITAETGAGKTTNCGQVRWTRQ